MRGHVPPDRGKAVQGDALQARYATKRTRTARRAKAGGMTSGPHCAAALTLRLEQWDERPWSTLPTRLAYDPIHWVGKADEPSVVEGVLIISRWLSPSTLRRIEAVTSSAAPPIVLCTAAPSALCARALRLGIADIVRDEMHKAEVMARLALRCGAHNLGVAAQWVYGALLLDRMQRMAWLKGRRLRLTALQFDLLAALIMAKGAVVAAETLREAVWHTPHDPGTNRLAVHIFHLRRAMEDAGGGVAVRAEGGGYALVLEQPA